MNPSEPPPRGLPTALKAASLPRVVVSRNPPISGAEGRMIHAFDVSTVERLIEVFEIKERELNL
ncbi:MAG: hypothetical protein QOI38_51 [Sphingomonadales bacterium]|jgi:hypothetical protein|nr:hypothetical protein [Sphingomonadales bacterium]